jgi:hypothetical protein
MAKGVDKIIRMYISFNKEEEKGKKIEHITMYISCR